jgi:hypothetical protein
MQAAQSPNRYRKFNNIMFCLPGRLIEKAGNGKQSVNEEDGEPGSKRQAQAGAFHELLDGGKLESGCDAQYVRGFWGGGKDERFRHCSSHDEG